MNCYLCDGDIPFLPSWRGLLLNETREVVCPKCKDAFEPVGDVVCKKCGNPGEKLCKDCQYWETTEFAGMVVSGTSLYRYNGPMQTYLHQYKFLQDVVLAEVFAFEVHEALGKSKAVVVPIPMNPGKLKERTFPQVDCLLDAAGIRYRHFLSKNEEVQGTKTKAERIASAPLFTWNGKGVPKKVVIVDDLYTTGTTMRHAAKALREAGTEEISIFSLIRG